MTTRITVILKGDAQVGHFNGEYTPEYYNESYNDAVQNGAPNISFRDVDGDYFNFTMAEIKSISFIAD